MEIKSKKITAVVGTEEDIKFEEKIKYLDFLSGITVLEYVKNNYKEIKMKKIEAALKICLLNKDILNKKMNVLSSNENEKLKLLFYLLSNDERIILTNFEKNLLSKELKYFKNLFKKMTRKYNKTVVLITNDLEKIMDGIDIILVIDKKQVILEIDSKNIYHDKIYDYIDQPSIIEFVKYARSKGIKIDDYIDLKELIKAIYRSVK